MPSSCQIVLKTIFTQIDSRVSAQTKLMEMKKKPSHLVTGANSFFSSSSVFCLFLFPCLLFQGWVFFSLLIKSLNAGAISILVNNNESLFSTDFSCKQLSENLFYSNRDLFSQRKSIAFINFVTSHKFHEITLYISLFRSYIWDKLNKPSAYQNARVIIY